MQYSTIKFQDFLQINGISSYFLHKSIKEKIAAFNHKIALLATAKEDDKVKTNIVNELQQTDLEILKNIKKHLIARILKTAENDIEIVRLLKRTRWTIDIHYNELKAMGLQSDLFWNTTIFGKLKLVRIEDYSTSYYIVPIAKRLHIKKLLASIKTTGKPIVEFLSK
ncbi:hypothetical protein HN014_10635 [Aquimarina sp. TRL1]|uniref:hypothetical protein n=1 Tax=Aquimarina sp. (strain TRL1) TaxID=2736252 RepID=UPI001589F1CA|nr:hypothetical protein [Aquimarina sp. TRL1]QKX05352.1 hypothetical protein HN014_10635 [Aquimarina sp. TRL1]